MSLPLLRRVRNPLEMPLPHHRVFTRWRNKNLRDPLGLPPRHFRTSSPLSDNRREPPLQTPLCHLAASGQVRRPKVPCLPFPRRMRRCSQRPLRAPRRRPVACSSFLIPPTAPSLPLARRGNQALPCRVPPVHNLGRIRIRRHRNCTSSITCCSVRGDHRRRIPVFQRRRRRGRIRPILCVETAPEGRIRRNWWI